MAETARCDCSRLISACRNRCVVPLPWPHAFCVIRSRYLLCLKPGFRAWTQVRRGLQGPPSLSAHGCHFSATCNLVHVCPYRGTKMKRIFAFSSFQQLLFFNMYQSNQYKYVDTFFKPAMLILRMQRVWKIIMFSH